MFVFLKVLKNVLPLAKKRRKKRILDPLFSYPDLDLETLSFNETDLVADSKNGSIIHGSLKDFR